MYLLAHVMQECSAVIHYNMEIAQSFLAVACSHCIAAFIMRTLITHHLAHIVLIALNMHSTIGYSDGVNMCLVNSICNMSLEGYNIIICLQNETG